ncbi:uncharacterized protein [Fopius arisanus]|uniref:Uncharacterized protein n=1 Tax=Fopius arisanus TaxID=64838 RepID=A0A9R1TA32_9HYME|nr:PREDICTED: uncharacterized protein LOC105267852 [Fopius arisanus]
MKHTLVKSLDVNPFCGFSTAMTRRISSHICSSRFGKEIAADHLSLSDYHWRHPAGNSTPWTPGYLFFSCETSHTHSHRATRCDRLWHSSPTSECPRNIIVTTSIPTA